MELGDGVKRIDSLGGFFFVDKKDGTLLSAAMLQDGGIDSDGDDDIKWVEVTAPESQEVLDTINIEFGTSYVMSMFAGR